MNQFEGLRLRNYKINKKLCEENPEIFMICPKCSGTMCELTDVGYRDCAYCNHQGVITWIDRIIRGKKNPFLEGGKQWTHVLQQLFVKWKKS